MTWIDTVLLLIIAQAALAGYRRGFFSIMAGLVGLVVGVVVAARYHQPVGEIINRKFHAVYYLQTLFLGDINWSHPAAEVSTESFPAKFLPSVVQELPVPDYFRQFLLQSLNSTPVSGKTPETVGGVLSLGLSQVLFNILVFVGIVLLVVLTARIIASLLSLLADDGVLGLLNHVAGLALNVTVRGLVLTLLVALLAPVISLSSGGASSEGGGGWAAAVSGSWLVPRLIDISSFLWQNLVAGGEVIT